MKKIFLLLCLGLSCYASSCFAAGGFFDSFVIVNANGTTTYYDLSANSANANYQGTANLGNMSPSAQSLILGGQIKTFKNNGTDITGVSIFYRIYPQGSPSGSFIQIPYSFQIDNVNGTPGDQQWGTDIAGSNVTDDGVNVLNGSTLPAGIYTLEVYVRITTNGVNAASEIFDSNSSTNYQANFVVTVLLPVELTEFYSKTIKDYILIGWTTASELNNSHFEVERSENSKLWKTIGKVQGYGTTLETQTYQFIDEKPSTSTNYYRLKQVDVNGSFEYSHIVVVENHVRSSDDAFVFPNPASDWVQYQLPKERVLKNIQIFDAFGKLVKTDSALNGTLNLGDLPRGWYVLVLETNELRYRYELIKQ
ncbi:MAG: T9SS type A sorting domain-containing protein [Saprospiraceae bacterium]|nr:T9SS type A sorting domain-containing protein [Saprospiraceae bacterium]